MAKKSKKTKSPAKAISKQVRKGKSFHVAKTSKATVITKKSKLDIDPKVFFGEHTKELMKDQDFKAEFQKQKQAIIDGYKQINSPQFCKVINDLSSGLRVCLLAIPENADINHGRVDICISTMVGSVNHVEKVSCTNLKRACEFISDFGQIQSARFCETAIRRHARVVVRKHISVPGRSFLPSNLQKLNREVKNEELRRHNKDEVK